MLRALPVLLALIAAPQAAQAMEVAALQFYCGSLSDAGETTALDFYRLGEYARDAAWMGVVRAPRFISVSSTTNWCLDMHSQDVTPSTCRRDGPPAESGDFDFQVRETLVGTRADHVRVAPGPGVRLLLQGDFREPEHPKVACTQRNLVATLDGQTYFSPAMIALDPRRDYVLVVRRTLADAAGPSVAAFALIDQKEQTLGALRKLARQAKADR